jgi:beta-galactosidase
MKVRILLLLFVVSFIKISPVFSQFVTVPVETDINEFNISLNGNWYFNESYEDKSSPPEINDKWKEIEVPGEWFMQGFEVVPGEEGSYFREFMVPSNWNGRVVFLRCDAVFSQARIWVNDKDAGIHTGPMVAFEKEMTDYLKYGETNKILIKIVAETLADTLMSGTQYAAHQLGGILRKIYLYAVPEIYISDLSVITDFDTNFKNADLKINGIINNINLAGSVMINISLRDPLGYEVHLTNNEFRINFNGEMEQPLNLEFPIERPVKWDSEHPELYQLDILVKTEGSFERIQRNIGFREIDVVGNQLYVNGIPVKLRGVNRHEAHPLRGRSLTPELWQKDARLYKEANVNYIRTSHYPPSEEFIEWCDKLGLYVELENPLCWIGHHANEHWKTYDPHNPDLYPYMEKIANTNISFFRNHPGIIIWSMANESAWGPNWAKLAKFYSEKDPSRPATFHDQAYGGFNNYGSTAMPVANIHYPGKRGHEVAEDFPRPLLFGEYAHLNAYNRSEIVTDPGVRDVWGRAFIKMWENMYKSRGCLGGAIWSGIDDVFYVSGERAVGYGEWGPVDGWRRKKPEYFHIKKSYSPVKIHNRRIDAPSKGEAVKLQVENRFDVTNLNECLIKWSVGEEEGMVNMDLPPGRSGILRVYPRAGDIEGKEMSVSVFSPQGLEVESCMIEIGEQKRDNFPFNKTNTGELIVNQDGDILSIEGTDFRWLFDLNKGKLAGAYSGKAKILTGGAELMILSLKTGECKTDYSLNIPFHNDPCSNWVLANSTQTLNNDSVVITVEGSYDEAEGKIFYKFSGDGSLAVSYIMTSKISISPRQWGMVFKVPGGIKNLDWYRKGFWSNYPDDHIGRTKGSAIPFDSRAYHMESPRLEPENHWSFDANELGTNDFRATRENIYWASLTSDDGAGIVVLSEGKHAFRSFVDGESVSFLVADYSTGGGDGFFSSHYSDERRPLKEGTEITGAVTVQLVKSKIQ